MTLSSPIALHLVVSLLQAQGCALRSKDALQRSHQAVWYQCHTLRPVWQQRLDDDWGARSSAEYNQKTHAQMDSAHSQGA